MRISARFEQNNLGICMQRGLLLLVSTLALCIPSHARAWFFIFPVPNLAKPAPLNAIIDALEKSEDTRAVAYVSEDKVFGSKHWVWGSHSAVASQEEVDRIAINKCEMSLTIAKAQKEGGQPLYNYGAKKCELHQFTPNDGPKRAEEKRKAEALEKAKQDEIDNAKRNAIEEERRRVANEEQLRASGADDVGKQKPQENSGTERDNAKKPPIADASTNSKTSDVDFNAEARKSAKILGCTPKDLKVSGVVSNNIKYLVTCNDGNKLSLLCDQSGLCLKH